ncbi:MAG: ABC transporter permease [bacterium]|jgi:ABC-type lipoprotein release transport system permease subunit|nr:ABC transporter permease [Gemmatimonadota bacterium]HIL90036.1 ABC transporter permease [Gemmatimonadota bacterium]
MAHERLWWRVAWRNLWRNRLRTLITASGLAFGYLGAVLVVGVSDGMLVELIENGTRLMLGEVQVHSEDYLPERNMHHTIGGYGGTDLEIFISRVTSQEDVSGAAPRVYGGGLLSYGEETQAALLMGVDPDREPRVTTLLSRLVSGRTLVAGANEILVGDEMAEQLGAVLGDEIVVVAPSSDGSLGNDLFTLVGILDTGIPAIDQNYALLALPDLQFLMAMGPTRIHEVVITVGNAKDSPRIAGVLGEFLSDSELPVQVSSWTDLRPELAEMVSLMDASHFIIVIVIFGMAAFGVANTMLIGTFERRREFAVIRALGTAPIGIGRTVIYEGIILGMISLIAGALITWPILVWWHNSPIDLTTVISGFSVAGAQWRPVLRVEYSVQAPIVAALGLFLTSILAAMYPAWKATRVPPADALAD